MRVFRSWSNGRRPIRQCCKRNSHGHRDPRDPATGTLNAAAIAAWSPSLADAMEQVLDATGCCSSTGTPTSINPK
jgi:hypothetical protein